MIVTLALVFLLLHNFLGAFATPITSDYTDAGGTIEDISNVTLESTSSAVVTNISATPRKRGDYKIKDCKVEQILHLKTVIDSARDSVDAVLPILEDYVNTKPNGEHGISLFEVFLGPPAEQAAFVKSILQLVSDLRAVGGKKPYTWRDKPPAFVCVTEDTQKHWPDLDENPIEFCEKRKDAWGYGEGHYRFVFLCPKFWEGQLQPPPRTKEEACPRVTENHFIDKDGERLIAWQKYLIIHELIHQYLAGGGLGEKSDPPEVYGLDECVGLERSKDRTSNPNNFVFWMAMVEQECTLAPDPYQPPFSRGPMSPRGSLTGADGIPTTADSATAGRNISLFDSNLTLALPWTSDRVDGPWWSQDGKAATKQYRFYDQPNNQSVTLIA